MTGPIRINLLPAGMRRPARPSPLAALPWKRIGTVAGGLALFITLFLFIGNMQRSRALARLMREWEELLPQRRQFQELQAALEAIRIREQAVLKLKAPQARWAPRMDLLSEMLVSSLWFQGMVLQMSREPQIKRFLTEEFSDLVPNLDQIYPEAGSDAVPADPNAPQDPNAPAEALWQPRLWLRGAALVKGGSEGAPVRRFIERLKQNAAFSEWFSGLELQDVGHEERGAYEVSEFILVLYPTGL